MTVINAETGLYAAFKFLPEGTKITVYTKNQGQARTNVVAELRKEQGNGWHDWQILKRPATAEKSLLPATWPTDDPAAISSSDLADTLNNNRDLSATVEDWSTPVEVTRTTTADHQPSQPTQSTGDRHAKTGIR